MSLTLVKIGGAVIESPTVTAVCADLAALIERGDRVIVIHGGGPQATAMQLRLGIEPNLVGGRRITDAESLDIMKMVLGRLNIDLCAKLLAAGARPIGLTGASAHVLMAEKRPPRLVAGGGNGPVDFGWVGDVEGVDDKLLSLLLGDGLLPVLACLGANKAGEIFNINGDVVANHVASTLRADHLVLVTGVPAVLRDRDDPESRIATMTPKEIDLAIDEGIIAGGMIPKLVESAAGIKRGLGAVHIVGNTKPGDLIRALDHPGSVGTAIISERALS